MEHVDQNSTKDGKNENNIQTQVVYIKYVHILYVNHTLIKWILKKNETLCSSFFYKISASILTVSWKEKYAGEEEWCSAHPGAPIPATVQRECFKSGLPGGPWGAWPG